MKSILIVTNTMGRAGAEKALLALLRTLDGFDVELLSIIDRGELFADVPPHVTILNPSPSEKPVLGKSGTWYIAKQIVSRLFRRGYLFRFLPYALKNIGQQRKAGRFQFDKLFWRLLAETTPVPEKHYHLVIAFLEGGATYYAAGRVKGDQKICFVHVNYEKAGYIKELDYEYYRKMDRIFCVSEAVRAEFVTVFAEFEEKTKVFHNIVIPSDILAAAEETGGFEDAFHGLRLLTIGRLHYQKGLDMAISALERLVEAGWNDIKWYVLGEGAARKDLERRIRAAKLEDTFILLGSVPNPYPYLRQCDLYVQPSRFEGWGLAVQEALILGKPVITTDFDGIPAFLTHEENALIIPPSEEAITAAIQTLLQDSELRESLALAASRFSMDSSGELRMITDLVSGEFA